jgi:hypothetical protein
MLTTTHGFSHTIIMHLSNKFSSSARASAKDYILLVLINYNVMILMKNFAQDFPKVGAL